MLKKFLATNYPSKHRDVVWGRGRGSKTLDALDLIDKFRNKYIARSNWHPPKGLKEFKDEIAKLLAKL